MVRVVAFAVVLCLAGCASTRATPLSTLLEALQEVPDRYDGKRIAVTAFVLETGSHGTLLVDDPNRPEKTLLLRIGRPDDIPGMHQMTVMMVADWTPEVARGVKAEFVGVIAVASDKSRVLVLESVNNLRWGDTH